MPQYDYLALDRGGKQVKGTVDHPNEDTVVEKLRSMGFYPVEVAPKARKAGQMDLLALPGLRNIFGRIKRRHLTTFTRQLSTLLDAGLPILRSLRILEEQNESPVFKVKIRQIAEDIEGGASLAEAFERHPKVFNDLFVSMTRAGEMGGVLETVLNKLADFLEKRAALISKVRSALMYPMTVMVTATCIVSFIVIYILPKFEDMFAQLGAPSLPAPTEFLLKISYLMTHQIHLAILAALAIGAIYTRMNKTRDGKYIIDRMKLKLPVFGELLRKVAIVRFSETLSTLIRAGVPILHSLDIVRDTSGNEVVARAMDGVYESVRDGETIHKPLEDAKVFPALVVHMVAVGEETGAIDQMLSKVAEAYTREVDDAVDGLTSVLEPMMIVGLGIMVGAVVICLYLPIFDMINWIH
ncbi:MAG: type II secretion system F family protein [Candidatus Sumerlaeota bacterium]|nr:type II secretion system F family protein [Candidatus Sumerlaeota bacterium]